MPRPALSLLLFLAACGSGTGGTGQPGDPTSCKLADVLTADLAGASVMSCGSLDAEASTSELSAARDCVLAAIEANEPFQVQWDIQGVDSRVAHAFTGLAVQGGEALVISSYSYDGDPSGGGGEHHPLTTTSSCATLSRAQDCGDSQLPYSLCLSCAQATVVDTCGAN